MNQIKKLYKKTPSWIKNKYFLSGCVFFIWITFFDTYSIKNQIEKLTQIQKIKQDIRYYNNAIEKDLELIEILSQDTLSKELETYFRETMFLSRKNEEIFMIE